LPEYRTALVTEPARGIGRQVALTLAKRGYRIAANDLQAPEGTPNNSGPPELKHPRTG